MPKRDELELQNAESIQENIEAKKIACYSYDLDNTQWRRLSCDENGQLKVSA